MIRLFYIAGRYRHVNPDGTYDLDAMAAEVQDEQRWARVIAECGHMWFAPLSNSVFMEDPHVFQDEDEFVRRDLSVIGVMRAEYDHILMRDGWSDEPISVGANAEREAALARGIVEATTMHGADALREYIRSLNGVS